MSELSCAQPGPTLGEEIHRAHARLASEVSELSGLVLELHAAELGRMLACCQREIERRRRLAARGAEPRRYRR